ncbi:MAG: Fe-S-containing protein [Candidatus Eiseniibacteriota bacterium]
MFDALIITLREGVEAVLVLAIALAYLRRVGRPHLSGALYAGAGAALLLSAGVALLATRVTWNEELAEGIAMLVGSALVATLVVWMWRAAPRMRTEIEEGLARATEGARAGGGVAGVFLFALAMVFREGVETAIFLSAARFNSEGLALWLGALAGLALAIGFGVLFVRGSVRLPLRPFFTLTSAVLAILALQLLAGGLHELSEALVLPASKAEMAIIGPIVRSDLLIVTLTIALAAGWLLLGRSARAVAPVRASGPEARIARASAQRDAARRRWSGIVGLLMVALLSTAFVQQSRQPLRPPGQPLALAGGEASFDPAPLADGLMRFYEVPVAGTTVRFFAVTAGEEVRTCFDACEICGDKGYYERGPELICRNCSAPIVRTSLGRTGGCNPIPLPHRRRADGSLAVTEADLRSVIPHLGGR